jgi:hypothetical protein
MRPFWGERRAFVAGGVIWRVEGLASVGAAGVAGVIYWRHPFGTPYAYHRKMRLWSSL